MTDSTLKAGSLLKNGEYRIVRFLGQGGFGFTYEAIQLALDRKVAVKEFFMKDCCERSADTSIVTVPTLSNRVLVDKFRGKFIREAVGDFTAHKVFPGFTPPRGRPGRIPGRRPLR